MNRYKLTISYDGTHYCGWQVQKNGSSIQSLIQKALQTILRAPVCLTGSGRTDAGVHACGQSAHFDTAQTFDLKRLILSLNALLPADIRILQIDPVEPTFHARYNAKRKIYHYHLHLDPILDPFTKLYSHQIHGIFDIELLQKASCHFLGERDFTSFANVKKNHTSDATRTLYRLDIVEQKGGIRLEFEGNGFLYKMVRNITGTLIEVAQGKLDEAKIPEIFQLKKRPLSGHAAPAKGLFLMQVIY